MMFKRSAFIATLTACSFLVGPVLSEERTKVEETRHKKEKRKSVERIGGGAAGGAVIGALAGGGKGAAVGAAVGSGGGYLYDRHKKKKETKDRHQ